MKDFSMIRISRSCFALLLCFFAIPAAHAATAVVAADAYINGGIAKANYGTAANIVVSGGNGPNSGLILFDTSKLGTDPSQINKAIVHSKTRGDRVRFFEPVLESVRGV